VVVSNNRVVTVVTALALGLCIGWTLAAQTTEKKWKSQEEFDLATAADKAAPQAKIAALDKWKQQYAQSDYADVRDNMYLLAYQGLNNFQKAIDTAADILKARPNDFLALNAIEGAIYQVNPQTPADLDIGEKTSKYVLDNLDMIFAPANKPANLTEAQFGQTKDLMKPFAQRTLGYVYMQKKDHEKAEAEITKALQLDPTQAQFDYFLGGEILAQQKAHPEKQPLALFYFARAAAYDGPNAMPAAGRTAAQTFVSKAYKSYHGSDEGLDKLLALAKTNGAPPAGFTVVDVGAINQAKIDKENAERAANPKMTLWLDVKKELTGDNGRSYFEMNMKDSEFPTMKGKIVSMTPATRPKEIVLGIEKSDVGDATLKFEAALAGKMEPGEELEFTGVPTTFSPSPFMVVFDVDKEKLNGWTGKNTTTKAAPKAPAKKQ
jgi:tetratricopeptide (TPR) repeat protein